MKVIRSNVFETNSSSCHSLIMCDQDIYQKIGEGEWFISTDDDTVVNKEGIKKELASWLKLSDEDFDKCYDAFLQYFNFVTTSDLLSEDYYGDMPDDIMEYLNENSNEEDVKDVFSKYYDLPDYLKDNFSNFLVYTNLDGYFKKYEYFETFEDSYTSKNGDIVVAFGYYGYDS